MRLFIEKILVFCIGVLIFFIAIEGLYRSIPNGYANKRQYYHTKGKKISVIFYGSSHITAGINPYLLKYETFNGAMGGQVLSYDYALFNKYHSYMPNLKYIVLAVDYQSFTRGYALDQIHKLEYATFLGVNLDKSLVHYSSIWSRGLRATVNDLFSYYLLGNKVHAEYFEKGNLMSKIKQLDGKGMVQDSKEKLNKHSMRVIPEIYRENREAIDGFIKLSEKLNIKMVLITSPACRYYSKGVNKKQLKDIQTLGYKLSKTFPHVYYKNYFGDKQFKDEDFYDADHLNERGARKLTMKVDSLLMRLSEDSLIR